MPKLLRPATPPSEPPSRSIAIGDLRAASSAPQPRVIMRASSVDAPACVGVLDALAAAPHRAHRDDRHRRIAAHDQDHAVRRATTRFSTGGGRRGAAASALAHALLGLRANVRRGAACVAACGRIAATRRVLGRAGSGAPRARRRGGAPRGSDRGRRARTADRRRRVAFQPSVRARPCAVSSWRTNAGLGGDPRLVELVGVEVVDERERLIDERADASCRRRAARAVARQHEQPRIAQRVDVRVRAGRPAARDRAAGAAAARDSLSPSRIAATSSAATSGWRAGGTWKPTARYASLTSRCAATARGAVCAGSAARRRAGRPDGIARNRRSTLRRTRVRIDIAGDDERQVVGDVVAAEELDQLALAEPLHALGGADHRPAIRVRDERGREQALRDRRAPDRRCPGGSPRG